MRKSLSFTLLFALLFCVAGLAANGPISLAFPRYAAGPTAEGLIFTYTIGGTVPGSVAGQVTSSLGSASFDISVSAAWLHVSPASGTTPATIAVSVDPSGLAPNTYTATLAVHTSFVDSTGKTVDATDTSTVTLKVNPNPNPLTVTCPAATLAFSGNVGQPIASQSINIPSTGGTANYTVTPSQNWLGATNGATGTASAISVSTTGMTAGSYTGNLAISIPGATPNSCSVAVTLTLAAVVDVLNPAPPTQLTFNVKQGDALPAPQAFSVSSGTSNAAFSLASAAPPAWLSITPTSGTTPQQFTVAVNHTALTPGTYTYNAVFSYPSTAGKNFTTGITVNVAAALPSVSVSPQSLAFSAPAGATANPAPGVINVSALIGTASASAAVAVSSDSAWLTVSAGSGTTPSTIQVSPNIIGQSAGTLTGKVTIAISGGLPASVDVPVTVTISAASIQATPIALSATGTAGQPPSGPQGTIQLTTTGSSLAFTIAPAAATPWLSTSMQSGTVAAGTPAIISVTADATNLSQGTQSATLNIVAGGQTVASVPVTFQVAAAPPPLQVSTNLLKFSAFAGQAATAQTVDLVTSGNGLLAFTATGSDSWIKVTPAAGQGSQTLSISADGKSLAPGKYAGSVAVTAGSSTQTVAVEFTVTAPNAPSFAADTTTIAFTTTQGVSGMKSQTVSLTNLPASIAGNTLIQWSVTPSTTSGGAWLSTNQIDPASFPFKFDAYADPTGLAAGTYNGTVKITATAGTTTVFEIPVTFTIGAPVRNSYTPSPAEISASHTAGDTGAAAQDSFGIVLTPAKTGLTYTATVSGGPWLTLAAGSAAGSIPATLQVSTDATGLVAGIYHGTVSITATAGQGVELITPTQTIPVTLSVQAPPAPKIEASAIGNGLFLVDRNYPVANVTSQPVATVTNAGSGAIPVTVTSNTPWLEFDSTSASVAKDPIQLTAHVRLDSLPAGSGTFPGTFTLSTANGVFYNGAVTLQVASSAPQMDVRPVAATVTATAGYAQPLTTVATIVNTGGTPITNTVTSSATWLTSSISSGTLAVGESSDVTLTVAPGLAAGTYQGTVTFSAAVGTAKVEKTFNIAAVIQPQVSNAPPDVTPGGIVTSVADGGFTQQFTIQNPGGTDLPYLVTTTPYSAPTEQLTCDESGNCVSEFVTTAYPAAAASIGNATGTVPAGGSVTIPVQGTMAGATVASYVNFSVGTSSFVRLLKVDPVSAGAGKGAAAASCNASTMVAVFTDLNANSSISAGLPTALHVKFTNGCGQPINKGRMFAKFSNGDPNIALQPASTAGLWTGTWVPAKSDTPVVEITVTALNVNRVGTRIKLSVSLKKLAGVPILPAASVVNSGDYGTPMATAPGSYISIFGTSLAAAAAVPDGGVATAVGGTQVTLGGRVLPLVFVSPGQINAFIPFDVVPGSTLPLQVVRQAGSSLSQTMVVDVRKPAMFLKDGTAARPGIVVDYRGAQYSVVDADHPVMAGDTIVLYSVGLGPVDQDLAPYQISPVNPLAYVKGSVKVTIGGKDAAVGYQGMSPGSLGLYQINALVPSGIAAGNQVPVVVTVEGVSTSIVTVPVR